MTPAVFVIFMDRPEQLRSEERPVWRPPDHIAAFGRLQGTLPRKWRTALVGLGTS